MAHQSNTVINVLEHFQVSPPPGSVPTTSVPLTFFDIPWLACCPMQRLFFYEFPHSTLYFMDNILPCLKSSLSLTLKHFYPFSANLICPPPSHGKPFILFKDGDSVRFTIAESKVDFHQFIANHERDVRDVHPFVPKLLYPPVASDGTRVVPILALQVVLFPNSGISIGAQFCHVAADGMAFHHFMKSWASVFRSGGDSASISKSPPCHDRATIHDPYLESIFWEGWKNWASSCDYAIFSTPEHQLANKVRTTYVFDQSYTQKLKNWISTQCMDNTSVQLHVSTFVVVCAVVWVCLLRSQENERGNFCDNSDKPCYLCFAADCRHRLGSKLPTTYFGNCLAVCCVSAKRSELLGVNGTIIAAKVIGNRVKELESGVLVGADKWMFDWKEIAEEGNLVIVAGSPKLRVYETDFGWGKPKKSEVVHTDVSGVIALSESREEEGGVEVGMALTRDQMRVFRSIFEQSLKQNLE